ncbi:MAG: FAD-dependent oxidoreductase, partial [Desulfovibrio sp.]|nr:FAD-dependent oxidoreductase [Desulfovibrio sp.]
VYDAIIVGAGIAGCSAAIVAARAGLKILLLEKSDTPGKMNMTGGRLYSYALKKLAPDFAATAPIQRRVVKECLSILTDDAASTLEYFHTPPADGDWSSSSFTVLRKSFDVWLTEQVQKAGATLLYSQRADSLIKEGDTVAGVRTDKESFKCDVVILADGAGSRLAQSLGLAKKPDPFDYATGAKQVIRLGAETINERFGCVSSDGVAWLFLGYPTAGHMGGGFLYTNKDSVSLGMVLGQKDSKEAGLSILNILEELKAHPFVKPLIAGGEIVARGGHMIPEGGYNAAPELADNGVLIAGDAASFCLNLGYTVRGMDLAILSGMAAANTVIRAKDADNFSRDYLWSYHDELERENLLPEMKLYKNIPGFLHNKRMFETYPQIANKFMRDLFTIDGTSEPAWKKVARYAHKAGFVNLMKDAWKLIKAF